MWIMTLELIVGIGGAAIMTLIVVVGDRLRPASWRHKSDEAAGELVLDLIKTFFIAVVAFVVVVCWQQFTDAHDHTVIEADALVDIYWDTHAMPAPDNQRIPALVNEYTHQPRSKYVPPAPPVSQARPPVAWNVLELMTVMVVSVVAGVRVKATRSSSRG